MDGDKGDPDSNRLMARIVDKLDGVLFKHGFEFKQDADFSGFCSAVEGLIFHYYDDITGGDDSYDPNAPVDRSNSGSDVESETLDGPSCEQDEEDQ